MKNFCIVFALCVMFFFAACSGGSKESVYDDTDSGSQSGEKNDSDDGDSSTDTTQDNGDSQHEDTDSSDSVDDSGDTTPDNGNTSEPTDDADSSDPVSDDDADTAEEENACKNNPCQAAANSTGRCIPKGTEDYSCECKENYTWENNLCNADSRVSNCTCLPANASWNSVSSITQTWNGTEWVPSTDATFSTTASTTKCRFICNQNYSWNDSECVAETRNANCEGLPENAVWNSAASITQTWDDENWVPSSTGTYNQNSSTTECRFKCAQNYNWNGSQCVAATNQVECTGLPENALWNTVSDITQTWSGTAWVPTNAGSFNETPSYSECRFVCKTNYTWNGVACAPDEMNAVACTGKPANAVWNTVSSITQTWNGNAWIPTTSATFSETPSTTECRFKCAENYEWKNSQCAAKSREVNCTALPTNAQWNTATKIMQTWDGNAWIPTNIGSFNTSASSSECYFKCNEHYTWNNTICAADQQPATCTGLPANAQWNSVSEITQTWNGNGWSPSTIGTYNTSASTTECRFKCNENYNWDSSTSTCIAATKPASCTGLPTNASWNTASTITQTWDGNAWTPSNTGTYNETASSTECRFKCNAHYTWKNSQCVADQQNVNCTGLPTNASWNTASSITQTWNGNAWTPSNTGTYNETPSSNECHYKCAANYNWNSSTLKCDAATKLGNCSSKPANAVWNDDGVNGKFTQTWNGNAWTPASYTSSYSTTAGTCYYECDDTHYWYNSECTSPCDYDPCDEVANSTHECIASSWKDYVCECDSGYYWWGENKGCVNRKPAWGNICTGQDKCYNNSETMVCPTESDDFFGQDAQYAEIATCMPQRFQIETISGKNVVKDLNTGLMWQQTIPKNTYSFADAQTYCSASYAGYSGWRLPTTKELLTIVDNSKYNPAIDTTYFPDTPSSDFWSSSKHVYLDSLYTVNYIWYVNFSYGTMYNYGSNYSTDKANVRCVRGATLPASSFNSSTVNGQGIVTDTQTGLIWNSAACNASGKTWKEALSYCETLTYAGYSDWRLPNKNELASLLNYAKYDPASNAPGMAALQGISSYFFWSSSTYVYDTNNAWGVNFKYGTVTPQSKEKSFYVKCVRNEE